MIPADLLRATHAATYACSLARAKPGYAELVNGIALVKCFRGGRHVASVVVTDRDLVKRAAQIDSAGSAALRRNDAAGGSQIP